MEIRPTTAHTQNNPPPPMPTQQVDIEDFIAQSRVVSASSRVSTPLGRGALQVGHIGWETFNQGFFSREDPVGERGTAGMGHGTGGEGVVNVSL